MKQKYLVAPYDAIKTQAALDGTTLTTSNSDSTSVVASAASAAATAIVFINADSGEGYLTVSLLMVFWAKSLKLKYIRLKVMLEIGLISIHGIAVISSSVQLQL